MRAEGKGLAAFHCRKHVEHKARHGSHWHGTYKACEIEPYRKAAKLWLKDHQDLPAVIAALSALESLILDSGPWTRSSSLRGLSAKARARIAFTRLRRADVKPEALLVTYLAVCMLIKEDPGSHRVREFRIVQVAKAVHRLASGNHDRWEWHDERTGQTVVMELHAYARSTGQVLRHIGEEIEEVCELISGEFLEELLALKIAKWGLHPARPQPLRALDLGSGF